MPDPSPNPRTRPRPGRARWTAAAALAVGAVALAGCSSDLASPQSATRQGDAFTSLWRVFLLLAIAVAALIWVLVALSIIRFRRRSREGMPSQRQYNIPLEVGYMVTPLILVAVLFAITLVGTDEFTALADDPDVTVEVHGFQWQWQFRYEDEGITLNGSSEGAPELVLPVGQTIRFVLVSTDVNHSFWVPEFLEKRDLIPGIHNEIDVEIVAPGQWKGRCAEYCGLDHWTMQFQVRAVPVDEYEAWVAETSRLPQPVVVRASDPGGAG